MDIKRVFLIVLDSFGIGQMPDASLYGDEGSNTLGALMKDKNLSVPNLASLGLFHIDGVGSDTMDAQAGKSSLKGAYARMSEKSAGKDTTVGHWEIAGVVTDKPFPTFSDGFPEDFIKRFCAATGRGVLCNRPYSGTEVIQKYGDEHKSSGDLIIYTSADSVCQLAAHEQVVPPDKLYEYCRIAREMLIGDLGVGRVIARPFAGESGHYVRTSRRHDFSLAPPGDTMLDILKDAGYSVISVGKIYDIFVGRGITESVKTSGNDEGIERTIDYLKRDFEGLCFVNLVDFDMLYGHRNDVSGYAKALSYFDSRLPEILGLMREGDMLMITGDHGCDPMTPSTDHSREYTPLLMCGDGVSAGRNYGTRDCFADIAATILTRFKLPSPAEGRALK